MSAAEELREYTDRSNALHQEYVGDPGFLRRYERFVAWQTDFMLPFYDDLRATRDYDAAVEYFVSDLTGIDISRRDRDVARVVPIMSRMLPETVLQSAATAMRLNARVLAINLSICRELYRNIDAEAEITETEYCAALRSASNLEECLHLVKLIADVGHGLNRVIHIPMIGITLRAMRGPARVAGFGDLQSFLERGYKAFTALEDVERFLEVMSARMREVFTRLFTEQMGSDRFPRPYEPKK